jgi:hypothetical protein
VSPSAAPGADPVALARRADPGEITCALNLQVQVDERAPAAPPVLAGPQGAVAEVLAGLLRAGFTALNFITVNLPADEQAERLAREVIPAVRAGI